MERCDCAEWKKWWELERGAWSFLSVHGIKYPDNGPMFRFCPFCGKELKKDENPAELRKSV
jgi:hypothetical protein